MLKRILKSGLAPLGYEVINSRRRHQDIYRDTDWLAVKALCESSAMWTTEVLYSLYDCVRYVADRQIAGDVAECGVWKGGGAMTMGETFFLKGDTTRDIYLYDLFGGADMAGNEYWSPVPRNTVEANIARTRYPVDRFKLIEGDLLRTLQDQLPSRLALLRLDVQGYEPTLKALERLGSRLSPGAIILQMDYATHPATAGRALNEFLESIGWGGYLHRTQEGGRIAVMGS